MKLLILSDLHLEFAPFQPSSRARCPHDAVVLAGDILPGPALVERLRQPEPRGN